MPREVRFSLLVKQNFDKAVQRGARALRSLGSVARSVAGGIRKTFSNAFNIQGVVAGAAPIVALGSSIKAAFDFETIETQFKVLLGSTEAAKKRMKELSEFSANTPFKLDGIAAASRQLHAFSEGALGDVKSLKLVGDAAATSCANKSQRAIFRPQRERLKANCTIVASSTFASASSPSRRTLHNASNVRNGFLGL